MADGAININVEGRRLTGPLQGFGQLWQKTYEVRLAGASITPAQLIQAWKEEFASFWPDGNTFYATIAGMNPGDVAVLNLAAPGGIKVSTGIMVIYSDDKSFAFMTPQGHVFAGMNTFSAFVEDGTTVAQIQLMARASDPLYEIACRLGIAHTKEDQFWHGTLKNLATHFGVTSVVEQQSHCIDDAIQWSEAKTIWHNAAIRTALYMPIHLLRKSLNR